MKIINKLSIYITALFLSSGAFNASAFDVHKASIAPTIDGQLNDAAWENAQWRPIDQLILGEMPTKEDFSGQYKIVWNEDKLFVVAEIVDDLLADKHPNPLESYWNDDIFEILIDEDKSGGNHQNNYNALAYHISLDNQAVDIDTNGNPKLMNDHIKSSWRRSNNDPSKMIWEVSVDIYPDTLKDEYAENEEPTSPVKLNAGKELGLLIAYCDNDGGLERENFMTSFDIPAVDGDKNRAYIDASVFEGITLVDK